LGVSALEVLILEVMLRRTVANARRSTTRRARRGSPGKIAEAIFTGGVTPYIGR
jgi:hypothetical protein